MCEYKTANSTAQIMVPAWPWILIRVSQDTEEGFVCLDCFIQEVKSREADRDFESVFNHSPRLQTGSDKLNDDWASSHSPLPWNGTSFCAPLTVGLAGYSFRPMGCGKRAKVVASKVSDVLVWPVSPFVLLWSAGEELGPDGHLPFAVSPRIKPREQTGARPEPGTKPNQGKMGRTSANPQPHVCNAQMFVTSYWDFKVICYTALLSQEWTNTRAELVNCLVNCSLLQYDHGTFWGALHSEALWGLGRLAGWPPMAT